MKATFHPVWKQVTPELAQEIVAFWKQHNAIGDEAVANARTEQVVCIARDDAGQLCGVGTAIVKVLPRLRQPMYYYRQFFAKALRGHHQELAFYQACKQVLQTYNQSLTQAESLGILLEIENAKIAHAYNQAIVPGFEAVFIGYSPRGLQLRVAYFEDAILLTPAPIRMQALPGGRAATR